LISISTAAISRYSAASSSSCAHHLHIAQVLACQLRHRDLEDVDVLLANQVEQKIEGPFESLEENLECFGRNIEVMRKLQQRFAMDTRDRRTALLRQVREDVGGPGGAHV
jgi:hypothetical protein